MKKITLPSLCIIAFCYSVSCYGQDNSWKDGGPQYVYVKPKKEPSHHMPYDKELKCIDCHQWDGVDAYTSATISLKKTKTGRLPQKEIRQHIVKTLQGNGDYREMYVLSTSFDNKPLGTCIEFTLDPETLTFYASSEKQTEKLFHIAANPQVSLVYVRHRDDRRYFIDPVGVQVAGRAEQLQDGDPGFDQALNVCISTLHLPPGVTLTPEMLQDVRTNQLVTKIIPERIVITHHSFKKQGLHLKQIWEAGVN